MKRIILLIFFCVILLSGCGSEYKKPLELTTNLWVGYAPLMYAKETGMLDGTDIRINIVSSLGESTKMFDFGLIDGFTSTQQEVNEVRGAKDALPVILIDRSYGADAVVSKLSEKQLTDDKNARLDVFYEKNTINDVLLKFVMAKPYMKNRHTKPILHDLNQDEILHYDMQNINPVIVSYEPYITKFNRKGYHRLIGSQDDGVYIYDALYVKRNAYIRHKKDLRVLNRAFRRSVAVLERDPRGFYEKIKYYMQGQSYFDFMRSVSMIRWIEPGNDRNCIIREMKRSGMDTGEIILD